MKVSAENGDCNIKPINIVLIGVDSLRADIFEEISSKGVLDMSSFSIKTNTYTASGPTQMAHPTIMCGELPLDSGGYQNGINDRRESIAELFQRKGWSTFGISTNSWLDKSFGYGRGFKVWKTKYNLFSIWTDRAIVIKDLVKLQDYDGAISEANKRIGALRGAVGSKCDYTVSVDYISPQALIKICDDQEKQLRYDEIAYVKSVLHESAEIEDYWGDYDISELYVHPLMKKIGKKNFPKSVRRIIRNNVFRIYPDASMQAKELNSFLSENSGKQSTFSWVYLEELHEKFWFEFPSSNKLRAWVYYLYNVTLRRVLIWVSPKIAYISAMKYVFKVIHDIRMSIDKYDLPADTFFLIYSDHGIALKETESDFLCSFRDGYVRVPLLVSDNVVDRIGMFTESAFSNIEIKGILESIAENRVLDQDKECILIMENTGRGACDVRRKGIRIATLLDHAVREYYYKDGEFDVPVSTVPEVILKRIQQIQSSMK